MVQANDVPPYRGKTPHFRRVDACIWECGMPADSREHGWSSWILNRFDGRGIYGEVSGQPFDNPDMRNIRIRCVCEGCNVGWMKAVEDGVIECADRLIEGQPGPLSVLQRWMLAQWAVKTAMVFEFTQRDADPYFTAEERSDFAESWERIPAGVLVLAARAAEHRTLYTRTNQVAWNSGGGAGRPALVSTIAFGSLALQVFAFRPPEHFNQVDFSLVDRDEWARRRVQIWPMKRLPVTWPPPFPILDLDEFHRRFESQMPAWLNPPSEL